MLIEHNPDDYETVITRKDCDFHKEYPYEDYPGCTCCLGCVLKKKGRDSPPPKTTPAFLEYRSGAMMYKSLELSVFEIIGHPVCIVPSEGQKVYDRIEAAIKKDQCVSLSFFNVTTLTPGFLNAAIGQLYGVFNAGKIRKLLSVRDMQQDDMQLLRRVIETAQHYFSAMLAGSWDTDKKTRKPKEQIDSLEIQE